MNIISRELIKIAQSEYYLQQIQEFKKKLHNMFSNKGYVSQWIAKGLLGQDIEDTMLMKTLNNVEKITKQVYDVSDSKALINEAYDGYQEIYEKIFKAITEQTRQKMKKVGTEKIIKYIDEHKENSAGIASMVRALYQQARKTSELINKMIKDIQSGKIKQDQEQYQINQI